ncbi:unnamed protein product [Cuscuta campestris]|uniref:Uncharacterized protein n=1 Tax=Cuscuta campestris TaxID=132261 RepID=A0A484KGF9_9ASTE|nr:unnamed protein product [Cuscuta campestris]
MDKRVASDGGQGRRRKDGSPEPVKGDSGPVETKTKKGFQSLVDPFLSLGAQSRPLSGATMITPTNNDLHLAHLRFLENCDDVQPYFIEHMGALVKTYPQRSNDEEWLKNKQNETFPGWFRRKISTDMLVENNTVSTELMWIVERPNKDVPTFSGYKINGVTYSTKERDDMRQVQCSGVCVEAQTMLIVGGCWVQFYVMICTSCLLESPCPPVPFFALWVESYRLFWNGKGLVLQAIDLYFEFMSLLAVLVLLYIDVAVS